MYSEPSHKLDCVVINVTNPTTTNMAWTSYDCNALKGSILICQYPLIGMSQSFPPTKGNGYIS